MEYDTETEYGRWFEKAHDDELNATSILKHRDGAPSGISVDERIRNCGDGDSYAISAEQMGGSFHDVILFSRVAVCNGRTGFFSLVQIPPQVKVVIAKRAG